VRLVTSPSRLRPSRARFPEGSRSDALDRGALGRNYPATRTAKAEDVTAASQLGRRRELARAKTYPMTPFRVSNLHGLVIERVLRALEGPRTSSARWDPRVAGVRGWGTPCRAAHLRPRFMRDTTI